MLRWSRRSSALALRSPVYLVATVAYNVGIYFKAWRKTREVPFRTISQLPRNMKTRLTSDSVKTCVIHHTNFKQFLWDGLEKFFKYFFSILLLGQSLTSEWISTQIELLQNYDAAKFNVLDQHTDISTCLHVITNLQSNFAANSFEKNRTEKKKNQPRHSIFQGKEHLICGFCNRFIDQPHKHKRSSYADSWRYPWASGYTHY